MKKIKLLIAVFLIAGSTAFGQFKGTVFNDVNGNGIKDRNEAGIENAIVSNGFHLAKTNKKGEFKLPEWEKQRFITIYPSSDQKANTRFIKIDKQLQSYNFPVQFKQPKKEVSFIQISDTETYEYKYWLNDLKGYAKSHKPDFLMHTGDICYRSGMEWHSENVTEKTMGIPVYYGLGNHDLIAGEYGEQFFEEKFGPAWYAFQEGNALYVMTPMMGGDFKPGFTRQDIGGWLQNLLETYPKEMPKHFFGHDLLSNTDEFRFKIDESNSINLNDYNLKSWSFGHWHNNMTKTHGDSGIKSYSTTTAAKGGIDHSPSSFRITSVDEKGESSSKLMWSFVMEELQIISPKQQKVNSFDGRSFDIAVNTYSSETTVDSVRCKIYPKEGNQWTAFSESPWIHLSQVSDWTWNAVHTPAKTGETMTMVVKSYLHNGKVLTSTTNFDINTQPEISPINGEWNNLAGNTSHDPVTTANHGNTYELSWVKNLGSNVYMSSPVYHNNRVYSATFDDGNAHDNYIVCLEAGTGKELWRFRTRNGIKNQMVIAANAIIATDMQGYTYALDLSTGKVNWIKDLDYNIMPGFISGIVTENDVVYTGFGGSLTAIDVNTGKTIWNSKEWSGGQGSTTTMTLTDDLLIVSSNWRAIFAHDKKTGALVWTNKEDGLRFRNGNILFKEGKLFIAENNNDGGALHILDPKTGKAIETIATGMENKATTTPVVTAEQYILASAQPGIASINRITKQKEWEFEVSPAIFYTPQYYSDKQQSIETTPMLINNAVLFGAMDGWIYNLDASNGKLLWKTNVGTPVMTTAAVTENGFFICDFAGNLYYFTSDKNDSL